MVSLRQPATLPIVGVVADGQTYRNLIYLLLAIPLGFTYSAVYTVGLVSGILLSVVLVGLAVLLAVLLGTRLVAAFERWLANRAVGNPISSRTTTYPTTLRGVERIKKYTDAASTWRGVGFVSLKFLIITLAFVPIFGLAWALPLIAAPLRYPYTASFGELNGEPVTWAITTLSEASVALPIGVVGVVVFLHVSNLIAYIARRMAVALLGDSAVSDSEPAVSDFKRGVGSTDADSAAATESVTVEDDHASGSAAGDGDDEPSAGVASEDDSGDIPSETDSDSDRSPEDGFEYAAFDDEDGANPGKRDADR